MLREDEAARLGEEDNAEVVLALPWGGLQLAACKGHNFECKVSSPLAQVFGSNWWLPLKWSVELVTRAQVTHHTITNSSNQT